ncbi:S-adenosyl-L-methionine-dependent methyltransferase [Aspergillus nidulans var. acristatus]
MIQNTYSEVQSRYGSIAKQTNADASQNKDDTEDKLAQAFGYTAAELSSLPSKANLGLSCGNPTAFANLKPGETIVDLGSGGGIDVFLAARKVGPEGRAIGVDMTEEMITLATANAKKANLPNNQVQFIKAPITSIPLPDSSADCIISNCVINLVPREEKPTVFAEIARLLKPGGRVAISDILARKPLSPALVSDIALYVGCVAGASLVEEYEDWLGRAGLKDVLIVDMKADINLYKQTLDSCPEDTCCAPKKSVRIPAANFADVDFNEWVGSFQIYAVKGGF